MLISSAGQSIYLTGRGLEAELAGNLHVTGRNLAIEPKGTLRLIKGKFHFGGKEFLLTQGDISFSENSSHLNLTATLNLADITVYALLRGPLQSPVLTFQSTPTLPTSSILARILFNKDISELTAAQLLQLADAIVSLSGGAAPSVLESIRQSIGVDRLNIVSGESDNIAVQVGKYLAKGVIGDPLPKRREQPSHRRGRTQAWVHPPSRNARGRSGKVLPQVEYELLI